MKLNVLAGRDVAKLARISLADLSEHAKLRTGDGALRNLDPQHLRISRLTLSVCAPHQPERAPLVGGDLAALVLFENGHERVDVCLIGKREPSATVGR